MIKASIQYHSTNRFLEKGSSQVFSFGDALLNGLAQDEGLYMPTHLPLLSLNTLKSLQGASYAQIASYVLGLFLEGEIPSSDLDKLTQNAYSGALGWEKDVSLPLEKYAPLRYIARMDQGPTASFKDFAARFMAQAMQYFRTQDQKLTILVATSGDTGSAVGEAFHGLEGIKVFILYPETEVSPIQKNQLDAIGGNVQALCFEGKFDDCQQLVKKAFTDPDLKILNLTSANSINIGRVLPQVVYYIYMYLQSASQVGEEVNFCIPSGNLGNSLGAEIARRMGLPIRKIIIGTNENKAFPDFLQTGVYQKISPSHNCISNAMNVGNPSNLARYFDLYGGTVDKNGIVHRSPDFAEIQKHLVGYSFSDEATTQKMKDFYAQYQIIIEPHGAIGILAAEQYLAENPEEASYPLVILETAHPAKFGEIVEDVLNIKAPICKALEQTKNRSKHNIALESDYETFKEFLLKNK